MKSPLYYSVRPVLEALVAIHTPPWYPPPILPRHNVTEPYRTLVLSFLWLTNRLLPLFYAEPLLGRRLPASIEMLYTLVIIHVGLFVIRVR
jgi:hypothetical protein